MWAPLLGAAKSFADSGTELLLMSQRTGIAVEALSGLKFAAEESGVSTESLETGLKKMSRTIQMAADENKKAQQTLASFGVTVEDVRNLSPEDIFKRLADGIALIPNATTRAERTVEMFGRGGLELLPMLNKGTAGIKGLVEEAEKLGLIKSQASVEEAFKLSRAFKLAGTSVGSLINAIGGQLAPLLTDAAKYALTIVGTVREWIKENRALFVTITAIGAGLTGVGIALVAVAGAVKLVATGIGAIAAIASLLATTLGLILSPTALITGAIVYLASQFVNLQSSVEVSRTAWQGLSDAIEAGDWAGAVKIALLGIEIAFKTTIMHIKMGWGELMNFITAESSKLSTGLATVLSIASRIFEQSNQRGGHLNMQAAMQDLPQISAMANEDRDRRIREAAAQRAADLLELQRLREEIGAAAGQARQKLQDKLDFERATNGMMGPNRLAAGLDQSRAKTDVKGTFSAFAVAGLGASSVTEQLLATANQHLASIDHQLGGQNPQFAV